MENFDAFSNTPPPNTGEEDPAAEFLAAEQNQMAQLEGDDFNFDQAAGKKFLLQLVIGLSTINHHFRFTKR